MSDLAAAPALTGMKNVGNGAGVRVRLKTRLAIVSVLARAGKSEMLAGQVQAVFGLVPIDGPRRAAMGDIAALGIGPGRWLFVQEDSDGDFPAALSAALAGLASLSDHSDGYTVFEISGPAARRALAKGVPVDLDEAAFSSSDVAVTVIAHIGAIVWHDAPDRFAVVVFRSYAQSFWHFLSASAAEFGLEVLP